MLIECPQPFNFLFQADAVPGFFHEPLFDPLLKGFNTFPEWGQQLIQLLMVLYGKLPALFLQQAVGQVFKFSLEALLQLHRLFLLVAKGIFQLQVSLLQAGSFFGCQAVGFL